MKFWQLILRLSLSSVAMFWMATYTFADTILDTPKTLSTFQLQDQYGKPFGPERLKGHWTLIFIGFTTCPDVCPMTLANLEAVRADLGLRFRPDKIPEIVFLAVDPARDKAVLKEYLAYFHPDYIGITGDKNQIDILVKSLGGFYRFKKPLRNDEQYQVVHTSTVYLINAEGKLTATLNPPFKPQSTGEFLNQLIRNRDRQ